MLNNTSQADTEFETNFFHALFLSFLKKILLFQMVKQILIFIVLIAIARSELEWQPWGDQSQSSYCTDRNAISIQGQPDTRMVAEGGRIVVTCCLPGNTSGHDHEQLTWTDPKGQPIINYFANAVQAAQGHTYAVPDFSEKDRLVSSAITWQPF